MTFPRPLASSLEQWSLLLLFGAVAVAAVLFVTVPLPASGLARAGVVLAIAAVDAAGFAFVWRRRLARERDLINEQLARAAREITESERLASVGRIAAGMAHEIGNPLTGIANYSHVLRSHIGSSETAVAAIAGIEREIDRIDRIVSSLLDYARPPQKRAATAFDAAGTLRQAVQLLSSQGVFRSVRIQSTFDESPLALVGDKHEIEQAFVNLLLNAIEAMEAQGTLSLYAGRLTPESMMRAPRRSGDAAGASTERSVNPRLDEWRSTHKISEPCAKFVIADSGPGVGVDDTNRIFDPFFTTKGVAEGSGLGLAIVQRVVDAHDGVVWVQRAREGGAAFHLVLPIKALGAADATLVA